jgi:hypothetical protein
MPAGKIVYYSRPSFIPHPSLDCGLNRAVSGRRVRDGQRKGACLGQTQIRPVHPDPNMGLERNLGRKKRRLSAPFEAKHRHYKKKSLKTS